jgi:mono/diheme cytochrome c family protein
MACCALFLFMGSCGPAESASGYSGASEGGQQPDAEALYAQRCATCHGMNGGMRMGGAARLVESSVSRDEVIAQIRYGRGAMPPFGEVLSAEQIEALADYSIAFRTKSPSP